MTTSRETLDADFAALSQQVTGLESDYRDLKVVVLALDKKIDASFTALTAKIDARNVTPWVSIFSGIGVLVTMMGTVGYLALQPGKDAVQQLQIETRQERIRHDETRTKLDTMRGQFDMLLRMSSQGHQ